MPTGGKRKKGDRVMRKTLPMNLQFFAEGGDGNGDQNAGSNNNGQAGQQSGQNNQQTAGVDYDKIQAMLDNATAKKENAVLKSYFQQQGLSEDEISQAKSTVKLNMPMVRKLTAAAKVSVAQTAEAIHTDVVQSQVMPRDTGALQNESTFVDLSDIGQGKAYLVSSTPYARRLYYHPEYNFHQAQWTDDKGKKHEGNANAKGRWLDDYMKGGKKQNFAPEAFEKFYKKHMGL